MVANSLPSSHGHASKDAEARESNRDGSGSNERDEIVCIVCTDSGVVVLR